MFLLLHILFARQFTRDNNCSIEFDAYGFCVKDLQTGNVILRCNNGGDLYTLSSSSPPVATCHVAVPSSLWHSRLGHPAPAALARLNKISAISCNNLDRVVCHACQLGKHARLPFTSSSSHSPVPFALIHCACG
jgi:hypothetical protein